MMLRDVVEIENLYFISLQETRSSVFTPSGHENISCDSFLGNFVFSSWSSDVRASNGEISVSRPEEQSVPSHFIHLTNMVI